MGFEEIFQSCQKPLKSVIKDSQDLTDQLLKNPGILYVGYGYLLGDMHSNLDT